MDSTLDDLALRDVHLPVAHGFDFNQWIMMLAIMVGCILLMYLLFLVFKRRARPKKEALTELKTLYSRYNSEVENNPKYALQQFVQNLSILIKRYVMTLNPDAPVYLAGDAFYQWLSSVVKNKSTCDKIAKILSELPYQSIENSSINTNIDAEDLYLVARAFIQKMSFLQKPLKDNTKRE